MMLIMLRQVGSAYYVIESRQDRLITNISNHAARRESHKARTRSHVLAEAAAVIRRKGAERVGVAEVMAGAGLTHGGF